ncbi:acyltransferase [Neobacillus notoginsengisoli]|uniref:Acyltransferase n=1 Tax=Neobacillus notoginsengisoli TaxID=1578198 RepID=A0A417YFB7_9BACI|nr:acyltransferase family protein [Neobacillus notoginsengisoli]RHW31424.1 acyltransferase [Neobacillus notoginsengisoli]
MKKRNYYFDNAKFILIFLVVFGHLLRAFIEDNEIFFALYKAIYTFHMPAFILISGFFAKGFNEKGYIWKIAKRLILPYIFFQIIYSVFYYYLFQKPALTIDPFNPHWSLWFLVSMFFWNLLLIPFTKIRPAISLPIAFAIGLLVGYLDWVSNYLSLSRTFVFFPLFLAGYYMKKEYFYALFTIRMRLLAAASLLLVFAGFYFYPDMQYQWLLGSKPYAAMGVASIWAMFKRLGIYALSFIMVMSFFAFVPRKQYFFTTLGTNTLYVYLLHGFFVRVFRESDIASYFDRTERIILLAGISLIIVLGLSSKLITSFTQPLIELRASRTRKLFNRLSGGLKLNQ